jgi:hypothetical protein
MSSSMDVLVFLISCGGEASVGGVKGFASEVTLGGVAGLVGVKVFAVFVGAVTLVAWEALLGFVGKAITFGA